MTALPQLSTALPLPLALPTPAFAHLHVHSTYSDGLASPQSLVLRAQQLGFLQLALTDHATLDGHAALIAACAQATRADPQRPITPVLGVEIHVHARAGRGHCVVLPDSPEHYLRLRHLVRAKKPLTLAQVAPLGVLTTACLGGLPAQHLQRGEYHLAEDALREFADLCGPRVFVELQPTFGTVLPWLVGLANTLALPSVVTNDVHYLDASDAMRHRNAGLFLAAPAYLAGLYPQYARWGEGLAHAAALAAQLSIPTIRECIAS